MELNGQVITTVSDMTSLIAEMKEGDVVQVKVFRPETVVDASSIQISTEGKYVDLTLTLAVVDEVAQ